MIHRILSMSGSTIENNARWSPIDAKWGKTKKKLQSTANCAQESHGCRKKNLELRIHYVKVKSWCKKNLNCKFTGTQRTWKETCPRDIDSLVDALMLWIYLINKPHSCYVPCPCLARPAKKKWNKCVQMSILEKSWSRLTAHQSYPIIIFRRL